MASQKEIEERKALRVKRTPQAKSQYAKIFLGVAAIGAAYLYQMQVKPMLHLLGIGQTIGNLNNQDCHLIEQLTGCEDQWIDRRSGISYLACTPTSQLKHEWFPPIHHLNTTNVPVSWKDPFNSYIALFNTTTEQITKLRIEGFPEGSLGLHTLHGFDLFVDHHTNPPKATLFAINHLMPKQAMNGNPSAALRHGADSVIEIFDTVLGSDVLTWRETFRNKDVHTPNNVAAISHTEFYVTNDHYAPTGFIRKHLHPMLFPTSNVQYCNTEGTISGTHCYTAADGLNYPNGITKGPGRTFYVSSSAKGLIYVMSQAVDNRFLLVETIKVGKIIDNLHVDEQGHIYAAVITKLKAFQESTKDAIHRRTVVQPVQAIRVSNHSAVLESFGLNYKVEDVFFDPGETSVTNIRMQTATNVQFYKGKLYFTSCFSDSLAICNVGEL